MRRKLAERLGIVAALVAIGFTMTQQIQHEPAQQHARELHAEEKGPAVSPTPSAPSK